ncbi:hypothetical protein [Paenibacillus sp. HB172176]|uniref:hypothetical protein n=1 Tax=Paenibacillus sp. HB172176 TaxID=2493690 RepID=UPI001439FC36|nr:hypothetical protein [Paenibacillus sp. HB172176]
MTCARNSAKMNACPSGIGVIFLFSTIRFQKLCTLIRSGKQLAKSEPFEPLETYKLPGWQGALDGDRLITRNEGELTVTDLNANKQLAAISVEQAVGFDMSGNIVVWSDLRNEKTPIGELGSLDVANADIFLYDLSTGEERQLTQNSSAQIKPKIWDNYIVWMDNASDAIKEYPSHWQIILYDIETGEQKTITTGKGGHTDPDIDAGNVV